VEQQHILSLYTTTLTMPLYEVHHSLPLSNEQRQSLATAITNLHCTAFTTPSFFVHIQFVPQDASDGNYFMAGKSKVTSSNRIIANVRTSPSRSKADFDALAEKIERAWYDAVEGSVADSKSALRMVAFTQLVAIREAGVAIPEAGHEKAWFQENMPYFKEMSEKGLEEYSEMLHELQQREDLKKMLS
jgi:phenylpyruvate tautomerase PptA (4-oxalocrotonate tautomerase family)